MELLLYDTPRIGIYMDVLKYRDIHIRFGTVSLCVGLGMYALVILCDHTSQTLQTWTWNLYCWTQQGHAKDLAKTLYVYFMSAS